VLNQRNPALAEANRGGGLILALGLTALLYTADYAVFRYRVGTRQALDKSPCHYDACRRKTANRIHLQRPAGANLCELVISARDICRLVFAAAHRTEDGLLNAHRENLPALRLTACREIQP